MRGVEHDYLFTLGLAMHFIPRQLQQQYDSLTTGYSYTIGTTALRGNSPFLLCKQVPHQSHIVNTPFMTYPMFLSSHMIFLPALPLSRFPHCV